MLIFLVTVTVGIALFLSHRPSGGAVDQRVRFEESGPDRISPPLSLTLQAHRSTGYSGIPDTSPERKETAAPVAPESIPLPVTVDEQAINPGHAMPAPLKRRKADLLALEKALTAHALHHGDFPSGNTKEITDALIAKGLLVWPEDRIGKDGHLLDGEKMPYYVETAQGGRLTVISSGPDKEFHTHDDIVFRNFEAPSPDGFP